MAKDPAVLLYYKDVLTSCASWDADALGWYFRLICHQADKPGGLENDLETLASLANVKFSQFERFKLCWEQTIKQKYKQTLEGTLINETLANIIERRRKYSEEQSVKGTIGALIKKIKPHVELTKEQTKTLCEELENDKLLEKNEKEKIESLQARLVALLGNVNANAIINKIKTGNGSAKKPKSNVFLAQGADFLFERISAGRNEVGGNGTENNPS